MKAIFTTTSWLEIDNVEEASDIAAEIDQAVELNFLAVLERYGLKAADLETVVGIPTTHWRVI